MGFLTRLFRAATPENPRFNLNDPGAWDLFLGGEPASSGVRVTRESALTYSPWWRGVNLLASDVAKLPLHVFRKVGEGKEKDTGHPAFFLLRRQPNRYQTAFQFRRQLTGHALSCGNGYAYIFRRGDGVPLELLPLDPDSTYPVRENGVVWYVADAGGEQRRLPADDVLHVPGFGYDGLCGYSVVDKARESLGLGMGARKYASIFFRNNARPSVVLETPNRLDDKAINELRISWERLHAGLDNAHRTAILQNGLAAKTISFNAEDAQLLQTREFEIREVANWLGVPPHKLGDSSRTAYNSLEQENLSYLTESLDPWLCTWEEECWRKLLSEEEKQQGSRSIEFQRGALVRADLTARGNYYRLALGGAPWLTRNEVRSFENLNPIAGGDELMDPLNMSLDKPPGPPPGSSGAVAGAVRDAVTDATRRMVRRLGHAALKAAKKPDQFLTQLEAWPADHGPVIVEALLPVLTLTGQSDLEALRTAEKALWLVQETTRELIELSGHCTPASLGLTVVKWMAAAEVELTARAVVYFLGE